MSKESEMTAPPAPQQCLQRRTGHATIFKKLLVKTSKIIIWKGNSLKCKTPQFCAVAKGTTTSTLQWYTNKEVDGFIFFTCLNIWPRLDLLPLLVLMEPR